MPYTVQAFVGNTSTTGASQALVLGREEFVRPMVFGNNWAKIRVGIHCSVYQFPSVGAHISPGSNTLLSTGLYLGVCSNGLGFTSPSPIDVVYASVFGINTAPTNSLTYYSFGGGYYCYNKVGSTVTSAQGTSVNMYGSLYPNRNAYMLDISITPNSPVVSFIGYNPNSAGASDMTRTQFLQNMQTEDAGGFVGNLGNTATASVTYNGSFNLNCVCVAWGVCMPPLLINEICVTRWY